MKDALHDPRAAGASLGRPLEFAWRSLVRQPARSALGILGVAAVGALLFDMLLLSEGLVVSMRDLLNRMEFDLRVTASEALPGAGPNLTDAGAAADRIGRLPSVRAVALLRTEDATLERGGASTRAVLLGVGGPAQAWTILQGRAIAADREVVLNRHAADVLDLQPGSLVTLRASCATGAEAPPPVAVRVAGIAEFPFDTPASSTAGTTMATLEDACGAPGAGVADFLAITSTGDPVATAEDIAAAHPELRVYTNEQMLGRLQAGSFTYFRQISAVLSTITVTFALLLIAVLLTVSVNQRIGEVAALRAIGFSRRRVVLDVLCESALLVGLGGLLSLPLGAALAVWLDGLLKGMPGIPVDLHFFVFEPRALGIHAALLAATAVLAALYPMHLVRRLPIAATLREEVLS